MTFRAVHQRSSNVSSHSHERNSTDGRVREPKPHHMGLQISCGFHSEMSAQDVVSGATASSGRGFPPACAPEGVEGRRRALDARSRACCCRSRRNMRCRRSSGTSRARARSTWLGFMESANAISSDSHFWARGFFVNTVGRDEEAIRAYIRNQEKEDQRLEQMNLWR